ncbi:hypothetical protein [Streptomyces sp. IMTB 1903]|uniref:hypothetical protein n=1 Tax=Streptomyces sp. IMTB 1903 TaxID=1776680 RepID=UPI000AA84900|nr:hypothetical protein [Streptomyces sp. IMTB 1903]
MAARQRRTEAERELLAAELVGRGRSGAPLVLAPERDDPAIGEDPNQINDFGYSGDPRGLQTPLGSHIRRMNPRDTKLTVLTDVNIRRIVRRGTSYGTPLPPDRLKDDGKPRGLDFIALGSRDRQRRVPAERMGRLRQLHGPGQGEGPDDLAPGQGRLLHGAAPTGPTWNSRFRTRRN